VKVGATDVGIKVGTLSGFNVGEKIIGIKVGIAEVVGDKVMMAEGRNDGEKVFSEQEAHTFKYLGVPSQGSLPNSLFVTKTVQEFCPTHFEINIALVVVKEQPDVAKDSQLVPNGVP
jgi:hypothetical protein